MDRNPGSQATRSNGEYSQETELCKLPIPSTKNTAASAMNRGFMPGGHSRPRRLR